MIWRIHVLFGKIRRLGIEAYDGQLVVTDDRRGDLLLISSLMGRWNPSPPSSSSTFAMILGCFDHAT
jgi:hypothetical protein